MLFYVNINNNKKILFFVDYIVIFYLNFKETSCASYKVKEPKKKTKKE